ncbi:siderophore-interacting protein [Gordonia sp. HY442]|uniref:siderophore-interacting protein n=1 Tax=Gordonia zhenghanii TaxID=2911516 RepID=UPI001F2B7F13|nr:siderophore-interacting protein [Gordonia zhenghanii]MCF8602659.1 siderophore-interacting protein [Gordonia zhenghanii]
MGKGFGGLVLKAMGGSDYTLTVTSTQTITDKYIRIGFTGGGLLADHPIHPTQWVRLWIPQGDDVVQRGYTLCDPDASSDTFHIEFAIHNGPAADWALSAQPGEEITATVMGSKFEMPEATPSEWVLFGDTASLAAINSLLDSIGDVPTRLWIEWQYPSDKNLPLRATAATTVTWVQRVNDGQGLREAAEHLTLSPDAAAWVACDAMTTRTITKSLRAHGLPKTSIKGRAYWK